jgi:hypothetical protein
MIRVVDLPGAEARAIRATRAEARRRGTGPAGRLTSTLLRLVGRSGRAVAPAGHLRNWRRRGGLAGAAEAIRAGVLAALADLPAPLRERYSAAGGEDLERRLGAALDRALARHDEDAPPSSRAWPLLGLLQSANQLLLAGVALWIVVWIAARLQVGEVVLPVLGPVPVPIVLLIGALVAGYVLARLLAVHAGWLGRRWARALSSALRRDVTAALQESAFEGVDRLETARAAIAAAQGRAEDQARAESQARAASGQSLRARITSRLAGRGSRPG